MLALCINLEIGSIASPENMNARILFLPNNENIAFVYFADVALWKVPIVGCYSICWTLAVPNSKNLYNGRDTVGLISLQVV